MSLVISKKNKVNFIKGVGVDLSVFIPKQPACIEKS